MRRPFPLLPLALLLASLAVLSVPGPALAGPGLVPIDDFEVGAFSFSTFGVNTVRDSVDIPGSWGHAIWSKRTIVLDPAGGVGTTSASLAPDTNPNDLVDIQISNTGNVKLQWIWGTLGKDLSFGGTMESMEMHVMGPVGGTVTARVQSRTGGSTTAVTRTVLGSGAQWLVWDLDEFDQGILTDCSRLEFEISRNGANSTWQVADCRFREPWSGPVDISGDFVATQVPPVPSPPLVFTVLDQIGNPLYSMNVSIADIQDLGFVPMGDWSWSPVTALAGGGGEMSYMWTEPGGIAGGLFDISFEVTSPGAAAASVTPTLVAPFAVDGPECILLNFPVMADDGQGGVGTSNNWITFDFPEIQGVSLEYYEVDVTPDPVSPSTKFTLQFRLTLSGNGSPDEQFPAFTATWLGDWVLTPAGLGVSVSPGSAVGEPVRLTAAPSVMRDGTWILLSRPAARDAEMRVHDVAGRLVRTLRGPAGSDRVRWDGLTGTGRPVPAGVYFVRLDGESSAPARVVRVR
ncbi:MAG TPA: FlgD immunoglobulin-like domain containing protein [bacterium]|nr:FlgD immunoglobulin-like domain containing protein [bacterium]